MKEENTELAKAFQELDGNIDHLHESITWACGEINRLRGENLELQLKIDNLLYMLRAVTQGRTLQ